MNYFLKTLKREPITMFFLISGLVFSYIIISLSTSFSVEIASEIRYKKKSTPPNAEIVDVVQNEEEKSLSKKKFQTIEAYKKENFPINRDEENVNEQDYTKRLNKKDIFDIFSRLENGTGLIFSGMPIACDNDEKINTAYSASFEWFNEDNVWHYPICSGRYYTAEEIKNGDRVILIGKDLDKITEVKNGKKYIMVNSIEYEVIGIVGFGKKSSTWDSRLFLPLTHMPDEFINGICRGNMSVIMYNNEKCINKNAEILADSFRNKGIEVSTELEGTPPTESTVGIIFTAPNKIVILAIMGYILALVFTINIISLWAEKREYEMGVRKAIGYSHKDIKKMLLYEMYFIMIIAVAVGNIIHLFLVLFCKNKFSFNIELGFGNLCISIIMIIITAQITIAWPMHRIKKLNPVKIM